MMKEAILAILLAVLFAILGSIAEYKYDLIYKWTEKIETTNE